MPVAGLLYVGSTHATTRALERAHKMPPDKTAGTGDQHGLILHVIRNQDSASGQLSERMSSAADKSISSPSKVAIKRVPAFPCVGYGIARKLDCRQGRRSCGDPLVEVP